MSSLAAAVGAPAPVTIGTNTYTASPVNLYQLGELEEYVRSRFLNRAATAAIGMPRAAGDHLIDRALAKSEEITFDSGECRAFLRTLPGMAFLVSISLRAAHPDMTPERVNAAFEANPDQRGGVIDAVVRISGFEKKGDAKAAGGQQSGEAGPGGSGESSSS